MEATFRVSSDMIPVVALEQFPEKMTISIFPFDKVLFWLSVNRTFGSFVIS